MVNVPAMETYLETLAGYIQDEDKLVTYKWLSKELEVHVNTAKLILSRYLERRRGGEQLSATHMLIGRLRDGGARVEVVRDVELARARQKFETIVSEHVYSLHKSLTSAAALAGGGEGDPRYSAVRCDRAAPLSDEQIGGLRWGRDRRGPADEKCPAGVKKSPEEKINGSREDSAEDRPVQKISPPAKHKTVRKAPTSKKPVLSAKTGYGNLFAGRPKASEPGVEAARLGPSQEKSAKLEANEPRVSLASSSPEIPHPRENLSTNNAGDKKSRATGERGKKRDRSVSGREHETKRRKRILVTTDSSSDEGRTSDRDDIFDSPPSTPKLDEKSQSPPREAASGLNGARRKVWKMVDKAFEDEDGFVVTRKVRVCESCSEDEEAKVVTQDPEVPREINNKPTSKKKQTTLTNFFKKS